MGKWFDYSDIIGKRKDLPVLTSKNGKTTLRRKVQRLKEDMPILYKDEDGKYVIEKSILETPYCGNCLRNHYASSGRREHFVCTIDDFWKNLPNREQDSFGKGCQYMIPLKVNGRKEKIASEKATKWQERKEGTRTFFRERADYINYYFKQFKWLNLPAVRDSVKKHYEPSFRLNRWSARAS